MKTDSSTRPISSKITLAALRAAPPTFSTEERMRLGALSQDEIDAKADSDPINPTWSDTDLERAAFARDVRLAREKTGLSQPVFAERFHIKLARLRDWERARFRPDSVAAAYIKTILVDAGAVERALAAT